MIPVWPWPWTSAFGKAELSALRLQKYCWLERRRGEKREATQNVLNNSGNKPWVKVLAYPYICDSINREIWSIHRKNEKDCSVFWNKGQWSQKVVIGRKFWQSRESQNEMADKSISDIDTLGCEGYPSHCACQKKMWRGKTLKRWGLTRMSGRTWEKLPKSCT